MAFEVPQDTKGPMVRRLRQANKPSCEFRLTYHIRVNEWHSKLIAEHTCIGNSEPRAGNAEWLARRILRTVQENPETRPADAVSVTAEAVVDVSYMAAYRALQLTRFSLFGDPLETFSLSRVTWHHYGRIDCGL